MEQQFILRLPESLKYIDVNDARIIRVSSKEVQLVYKNSVFPGIICRPPTVVESFKKIGNKMYKIADIAALVVIYGQSIPDVDGEIEKQEESGISPPLHRIKERYIQGDKIKPERAMEIEKKVMELLERDMKAQNVEVLYNNKVTNGSANDSMDEIAAELENELEIVTETMKTDAPARKGAESSASAKKGMENGAPAKKSAESKPMPKEHQRQAPSGNDEQAPEDSEESQPQDNLGKALMDNLVIDRAEPRDQEKAAVTRERTPLEQELDELQEKIKEKQELAGQALNPILKKRFQQSVEELQKKYEEKSKKL